MLRILAQISVWLHNKIKPLPQKEVMAPPANAGVPWMDICDRDLTENWSELRSGDNPRIVECFSLCGYGNLADETSWCGVYVGRTLMKAGFKPPYKPAWARNYSKNTWGKKLAEPQYGCVVNIERSGGPGASHVGFVVAWDRDTIRIHGGNQANKVSRDMVALRSSVISYKMPTEKI